jgi:hypothetical protein
VFKKGSKYTRRDVGRIVLPDLTFREDTLIDILVSNKNKFISIPLLALSVLLPGNPVFANWQKGLDTRIEI